MTRTIAISKCTEPVPPRRSGLLRVSGVLRALLVIGIGVALTQPTAAQPTDEALVSGFEAIVFGTEIPGFFGGGRYVKKFSGPVRFHIENHAAIDRTRKVRAFLASLDRQIRGLSSRIVRSADEANFIVHIVDRSQYQAIGRRLYRNPFMAVPGSCVVRSDFGRRGIRRSDALIVSDEGEALFERCLVEEVLQGLGPLNDNPEAPESVFNDTSKLTRFTRYDRIMMNALYDARLAPGMTIEAARPLLPDVLKAARRAAR